MSKSENSYKSILRAISLFASVQGLSILLNLVRSKLAALLLGPAGIGLNSIYNETREFIRVSTNMGMDVSGVREIAKVKGESDATDDSRLRDTIKLTRSWTVLFAIFGMLVTFILARPLSLLTFSDTDHTYDYMLLSPAIAFSTLTTGEIIVLKGIHRLKTIAFVSVLHVVIGLLTTIPLFYFYGMDGIIASLILMTFCMTVVTMAYTYSIYKPEFCFSKDFLSRGKTIITLGLSFVLSGFIAEGSKMGIQAFINTHGSLDTVGLYSAGNSLVSICAAVAFASMESDFFPRLSSVFEDNKERNITVCRQIEMGLYVIFPIIIISLFLMPVIVPLLLSNEFYAIVPMAQVAIIGLLFRAIFLPSALVPLAAGESKYYLLLQGISYISFVPAILIGFALGGITGAGIGILINYITDAIVNTSVNRWRYGIILTRKIIITLIIFSLVVVVGYLAVNIMSDLLYVISGVILTIISGTISYFMIKKSFNKI